MLFSTFGSLVAAAAGAAPEPDSLPSGASGAPVLTAASDRPVVLKVNSGSLKPTTSVRDPYFLDFAQITQVIPGGWAAISPGGPDFAAVFRYPGIGLGWKILSSTYNPALPISINLTINSANETGKIFNFEIDIDLDNDGFNDTFIYFPPFQTQLTLEPEYVNLAGTLSGATGPMNNARIYFRVWRTDTVPENQWAVARVYAGYIYESTITLPWINPAPTANMAKPDNSETYWTSLPVTFSAYGTTDPAETLTNLQAKWTFGDNSTPKFGGADANVTHTYRAEGWYNVSLNITNGLGFTDEVTRQIFVAYKNIPPSVSATVTQGTSVFVGSFSGFAGVPYNFSAVYDDIDNGKENVSISWDFGDGSPRTNETNVSHTFILNGTYNVVLGAFDGTDPVLSTLVANIANNRPPVANLSIPQRVNQGSIATFSAVGTTDPDGFPIVNWHWDFGDQFCTDANPCEAFAPVTTHRFDVAGTYAVRFTASDGISQTTVSTLVKVNAQPLAACPPSVQTETSRTVTFDGSLSRDPDGDLLLYRWKFGDGFDTEYSTNPLAAHVYQVPKPEGYPAQLIVNDGLWTHLCVLTVRVELINEPPIARIWCSAYVMWLGDTMRCSANQSTDEFELRYGWDFDASDGVSFADDFRRDIQYTYSAPGTYVVSLQVTDNKGKTSEAQVSVIVNDNPGYCNQIFDMSPFLRQSSASPAGKEFGEFDTSASLGTGNITAVKKGCWVAYSIEVKAGERVFVDVEPKATLEGDVVDLLMFDVPNFLAYKDRDSATLGANSVDQRCFEVGLRSLEHCEFTALKSGTFYIVIDNKDRPVLTPTDGPVEYRLYAKMPWPAAQFDPKLVPFLVGGAGAAVALVAVIVFLGRRAEKTY